MWHDEVLHFIPGRQIGHPCTHLFRGFRVAERGRRDPAPEGEADGAEAQPRGRCRRHLDAPLTAGRDRLSSWTVGRMHGMDGVQNCALLPVGYACQV
jgi:hypothetical protein